MGPTMNQISLSEFATQQGQAKAAELLGMTQGALSKALRVGRQVHVITNPDGSYVAEEVRPFPVTAPKKSAA